MMSFLRRRWYVTVAIIVLLVAAAGVAFILIKPQPNPIPKSISQSVDFPIYYPSPLPQGYVLDKNSIKGSGGFVSFTLMDGGQKVFVIEQKAPFNKPELNKIDGFHEVPNLAGQAAAGTLNGVSTAILLTDKSLVSVTGQGVPTETLGKIVQNMSQLN